MQLAAQQTSYYLGKSVVPTQEMYIFYNFSPILNVHFILLWFLYYTHVYNFYQTGDQIASSILNQNVSYETAS